LPIAKVLDKLMVPFGKKPPFSPKSILATGSDRRVDTYKARKELGWKSEIGYKDSFAKIRDWVLTQPDLLP
jgi:nucleoside-diphosphate-sugar epimerase